MVTAWMRLLELWQIPPLAVLVVCYLGFCVFGVLGVEAVVRNATPRRRQPPNRPQH